MDKKNAILKDYENNGKSINIRTDIMPWLFRDEEFKRLADLGVTSVHVNEFQFGKLGDRTYDMTLEMLARYGIKAELQLWKGWFKDFGIDRALTYDYASCPAEITGMNAYDEPLFGDVEKLADDLAELEKHIDLPLTVCLYPEYVDKGWLGGEYEEYVKKCFEYIVKPRKVARKTQCDYYPFFDYSNKGKPFMMETWAYNHMLFAKLAKEYDAEVEWCVQTCSHLDHRGITVEDFRLQTYMCMAFGVSTIECWPYATPMGVHPDFPGDTEAMIGKNFEPNDMYYAVQQGIKEIRKIENVYKAFKWVGTKSFIGKNNASGTRKDFELLSDEMQAFTHLDEIECTEDTIVSELYDAEHDRYAYVVVNYNDPVLGKTDEVSFKLKGADYALSFVRGECEEVGADVKLRLEKGDGAFIVLGK